MKYIFFISLLFLQSILSQNCFAQDLHFSQFLNAPLALNPANTGFIPNSDFRVGGNYRKQWASVPVPYKTFSAWGDAQIFRDKYENAWFGVGGLLLTDEAGRGGLQSNKIYGSVAYHQMMGQGSLLSVGFQAGVVNKKVNPFVFTWDNQWNGKFFDATQPSGENFTRNTLNYLDINTGVNYTYFPNEKTYYNIGVSLLHANQPKESFFLDNQRNNSAKVSNRFNVFANGSFKLSENVIINPNFYISTQAKASEIVLGGTVNYNIRRNDNVNESSQLIAGMYYRYKDAVIPTVGIEWKNLKFTYTYDFTVSNNLSNLNSARGGSEISVIYSNLFKSKSREARKVGCFAPTF
jgi:type IX secretion system PorP/SprF family membrane protein